MVSAKAPVGNREPGQKIADLREIGGNETKASEVFSIKCSNLARGESMKHPVGAFGCRRGFHFGMIGCMPQGAAQPDSHARRARTNRDLRELVPRRGASMSPWLEVLLNVIAFAGFVGIAKYHKSRGEKLPDR